jgi:hypothetical protein
MFFAQVLSSHLAQIQRLVKTPSFASGLFTGDTGENQCQRAVRAFAASEEVSAGFAAGFAPPDEEGEPEAET